MEDIELISEDLVESELDISNSDSTTPLRSSSTQGKQETRTDMQTISFDKYEVTLPKGIYPKNGTS